MSDAVAVKNNVAPVTYGKMGAGLEKSTPKSPMRPGDETQLDAMFEAMSPDDRKAMFDGIGKDLARIAGAEALASMLRESGLSGREIDARFGYDHAALSRTANGKSASGPTLWRLYALAEALGFDIELKVTART
ncbi:MAG: helix-turn-helix domain-containing protein [Phyllobacteriaceae bacterium]|jgi:hypothetical protein|nr:helix-turn-helix domain-containing protein [Phyllobacteriaceae bacterium]